MSRRAMFAVIRGKAQYTTLPDDAFGNIPPAEAEERFDDQCNAFHKVA